jgi:hypothetical protein
MIFKFEICSLALALLLSACGKAQFSGNSDTNPSTDVPVLSTGTDFYVEIAENFAGQISGDVDLTNVQFFGMATWPGTNSLQFELRASLTGTTAAGGAVVLASAPPGWATAVPALSVTLPAHSTNFQLASANLRDSSSQFIAQGKFWVIARIRYAGIDLTHNLTLSNIYVHAEGEKSLHALSPLIDLGF